MFGGPGGPRALMERESLKPKNASETLRRFGGYFKPFWPVLLLAVVLVVISTWTQVTGPELLGQAVDCYLSPSQSSSSFGNFAGGAAQTSQAATNTCWYDPNAGAGSALSND